MLFGQVPNVLACRQVCVLACQPSCLPGCCLAGMSASLSLQAVTPTSCSACKLAIHHGCTLFCNPSSLLAFMRSIMLAVTDFPRENLPKQCLGEMSDNNITCQHDCARSCEHLEGVGY
jgi:hypothetical protein